LGGTRARALAAMSLKGLRPPQSTGLLLGACPETSRCRDSGSTIRCTPVGGQVRTAASKSDLTAQHWNQDWNNDEDNPGSLLRPKPLFLARPPLLPSHRRARPRPGFFGPLGSQPVSISHLPRHEIPARPSERTYVLFLAAPRD